VALRYQHVMADRQAQLASALDDLARSATASTKGTRGHEGHEEGTAAPVGEWHRCQQVIYLGGWWSG
jgi:hypothetical protein